MIYIFDIDGTLTPSRNPMDIKFKEWFTHWSKNKRVWMVTGSDRSNFSTIGRNCTQEQRDEYYSWDRENKEREKIVKDFNEIFQDVTIAVGGQISLDVMPVDRDKGQILNDITSPFTFFGDHLFPGGNDFPILKKALEEKKFNDNKFYHVDNWQHTWEILKLIHLT